MTRVPTPDPTTIPRGAATASGPSSSLAAATQAEHLRAVRAATVDAIRAGSLRLDALDEGPVSHEVDQVKIVVLAEAVPGVGKVRARHVLDSLAIAHGTRWGELGDRRRDLIAALAAAASGTEPPTQRPFKSESPARPRVTGLGGDGA